MIDTSEPIKAKPPLDEFVEQLRPTFFSDPNAVYWVSVDLRMAMRGLDVHHTQATEFADQFIGALTDMLGAGATLLVPAYCLMFPHTGLFDVRTARVITGAFGGLLAKKYPQNRTLNPFYSFMVFGAKADEFLARRFEHSTGRDSVLEWVVEQGTELVAIGHNFVKAMTTVHHAEEMADVPYRYRKSFSGRVIGMTGETEESFTFYVRDVDVCNFSSFTLEGEAHFHEAGIVATELMQGTVRPLLVQGLNLKVAHDEMVADLRSGQPRLVEYLGPDRPDPGVITSQVCDKLYIQQLKAALAA